MSPAEAGQTLMAVGYREILGIPHGRRESVSGLCSGTLRAAPGPAQHHRERHLVARHPEQQWCQEPQRPANLNQRKTWAHSMTSQIAHRRRTGREYRRVERRRFHPASRRQTAVEISLHGAPPFDCEYHLTFTLPAYGLNAVSIPQEHCQYQRFHLYYLVKCEYNNGRDVPNIT